MSVQGEAGAATESAEHRDTVSAEGTTEKSPVVAGVLSFVIPGVGEMYNGQTALGVISLFSWLTWIVVAVVATVFTVGIFLVVAIPAEFIIHALSGAHAYIQSPANN
jgi:TM2 domain-containing membrane protein YozV